MKNFQAIRDRGPVVSLLNLLVLMQFRCHEERRKKHLLVITVSISECISKMISTLNIEFFPTKSSE